jgi:long-chain acyl-CoA synthetase
MKSTRTGLISPQVAATLDGLFHERVNRSPQCVAYRHFDEYQHQWHDLTWGQMAQDIARWQAALMQENLQPGDRVAIMLKNCPTWIVFDQAALGLGLVTVPIYTSDRPENIAHVLHDSGARLLLLDRAEHWKAIRDAGYTLDSLARIITMKTSSGQDDDDRLRSIGNWLPTEGQEFRHRVTNPHALATIVYTSGTTGKSKGVMLSHHNLLSNAWSALQLFEVRQDDCMLSFLPLSHALERMAGYYLPVMAGATVAYARSIQQLQEDLSTIRPTILISVPRIFERIRDGLRNKLDKGSASARKLFEFTIETGYSRFEHAQERGSWRWSHLLWPLLKCLVADRVLSRLGGRLRLILCGGAAVSSDVSRTFIGLGLNLLQGYGLTETSPVISVNQVEDNLPGSVGKALDGVEIRIGQQHSLEIRGPNVMLGYWNNEAATQTMFTSDGWLITGDVVRIDDSGHITITGRLKEIIVLSNGEKIPPVDIEAAILNDPLFEQVMVIGEAMPYLSLLAVVNRERWYDAAREHNLTDAWPAVLQHPKAKTFALARVTVQMKAFPGYARIRRIALLSEPWTVDNGLLTPTLKLIRNKVQERFRQQCQELFESHHH